MSDEVWLDEVLGIKYVLCSKRQAYEDSDGVYYPGDVFFIARREFKDLENARDCLAMYRSGKYDKSIYDIAPVVTYWLEKRELRHRVTADWKFVERINE